MWHQAGKTGALKLAARRCQWKDETGRYGPWEYGLAYLQPPSPLGGQGMAR